jgi:hypothetical protein
VVSNFVFPPIKEPEIRVVRLRDLLPGIRLDDPVRYVSHVRLCVPVKVIGLDGNPLLIVELPEASQLIIFVRCIRVALEVSDTDGVAMYLPNPGDVKRPKSGLINSRSGIGIGHIFPKSKTVMIRIVKDVSQAFLDEYKSTSFTLLGEGGLVMDEVMLDLPADTTVGEVLRKFKEREDVPKEMPLRMLVIGQSQILGILEDEERLPEMKGIELRVDFAPDLQAKRNDLLLKCAYSQNFRFPPGGCFGRPFLLPIEAGELFELTKVRIDSLIPDPGWGTPEFVLFLGRVEGRRFIPIEDGMAIGDLARDPEATLFVLFDPEILLRWVQRSRQTGLRINN